MRNLANPTGTTSGGSISGLLPGSQGLVNAGTTAGTLEKLPDVITNDPESTRPSTSASKKDDFSSSQGILRALGQCGIVPISDLAQKRVFNSDAQGGTQSDSQSTALFPSRSNLPGKANEPEVTVGRIKLNNIDLNNVCDDSQDYVENLERSLASVNPGAVSLNCPLWLRSDSQKTSPPQMSRNSDSTSSQSPSSSSGEAQVFLL